MRQNSSIRIKLTEQVNAFKANDEATLKALYLDIYNKIEKYVLNNNGTVE